MAQEDLVSNPFDVEHSLWPEFADVPTGWQVVPIRPKILADAMSAEWR